MERLSGSQGLNGEERSGQVDDLDTALALYSDLEPLSLDLPAVPSEASQEAPQGAGTSASPLPNPEVEAGLPQLPNRKDDRRLAAGRETSRRHRQRVKVRSPG